MEGFHLGGGSSSSNNNSSRVTFLNLPLSSSSTTSTPPSLPPLPASSSYYTLALHQPQAHQYMCTTANTSNTNDHKEAVQRSGVETSQVEVEAIKAKIMSHPQYSALLGAYIDCQKVGAPPDVVKRLSAVTAKLEVRPSHRLSPDPELDQFMEAYCNMLVKYHEELSRPIEEAMGFLCRVDTQLNSLTDGVSARRLLTDGKCEGVGSSEDDVDPNGREGEPSEIDPRAEDKELKYQLLKKYSGYLSSLRQEVSKKKKKEKLPKEARQKLLHWWEIHSKWPYPSEGEKIALAESTGLDQKQINNWFINQRKRHWKPSEDMPFVMMEGFHPQNAPASLYMDGQFMAGGMYRLGS